MKMQDKKKANLRINMAQTLDGHTISPDGKWALGSAEDKRRMDNLRIWADCIIASRRSIENDNPNLIARSKPNARHPRPIIILRDASRKIPSGSRIFNHPHPPGEFWIQSSGKFSLENLIEGYGNLEIKKKNRIDQWQIYTFSEITGLYDSLKSRGYRKILLEGGPTLNGIFLREDLIDEIFFTLVPWVWAGNSTDRIISSPQFFSPARFKLLNVERRKNEVFFRYKRNRSVNDQ